MRRVNPASEFRDFRRSVQPKVAQKRMKTFLALEGLPFIIAGK